MGDEIRETLIAIHREELVNSLIRANLDAGLIDFLTKAPENRIASFLVKTLERLRDIQADNPCITEVDITLRWREYESDDHKTAKITVILRPLATN